MTPTQLCDLASRINAAVPGLVPYFCRDIDGDPPRYQEYIFVDGNDNTYTEADAAAMMLGRVVVKRQKMDDSTDFKTDEHLNVRAALIDAEFELYNYVATTLPGAKA